MGSRIVDYIRSILVSWIDFRVLQAFCQYMDFFVDDAVTAKSEAFLETQSGEMLDYTARNSGDRRIIYRFPTPESDVQLKAYLRTRWTRHLEAGTLDALDYQTTRYGFTRYTWVDELSLRELGYTAFGQPANGLIGGPPYSPINATPSGYFARDGSSITSYQMWPNDGDTLPGGGTASENYEPGPGTGFFAIIIHPPHYFQVGFLWDSGPMWDDAGIYWDFGAVLGYPGVPASVILDDYATLIRDWRPAGSSLRHIVIDFVGDCVIDNSTSTGYSGTSFVIFPTREPAERLPSGGYPNLYNFGWK